MEKVQAGQSIMGDIELTSSLDTQCIRQVDFLHGTVKIPSSTVVISFESCFFDDIWFDVSEETEEIIFTNCTLISSRLHKIPKSCIITILTVE